MAKCKVINALGLNEGDGRRIRGCLNIDHMGLQASVSYLRLGRVHAAFDGLC